MHNLGVTWVEEIVLAKPLDLAIRSWRQQKIKLNPPARDDDTQSTFRDCGRPPTADVLNLYRRVNGFEDGECCQNHWSLWSLAKVREENQWNDSDDVWFADYLIHSYYFSLHAEDSQTSSVHVQMYDETSMDTFKVADTLEEFLEKLVTDPAAVYVFPLPDTTVQNATFLQRLRMWWNSQT